MAQESVTKNWGHRKDILSYWEPENHRTKSEKSKKNHSKRPVSYYDILLGPQKWMLMDAYQQWNQPKPVESETHADEYTQSVKFCEIR